MGLWTNIRNKTIYIHTAIPCSSQGLGSKTPAKSKNPRLIHCPHKKKILVFISVFLFFAHTLLWQAASTLQTHCYGKLLQLLEHHAVWLKDLLEMSNNFDTPFHRRAWMMYFYSSSDPSNLQTHNKKGITVNVRKTITN